MASNNKQREKNENKSNNFLSCSTELEKELHLQYKQTKKIELENKNNDAINNFKESKKSRFQEYRQRKKLENKGDNSQSSFTELEKERHRQYRQKRKNEEHEDKSDNSQCSFTKLEKERHRQYRQKRKNEEHENNTDNTQCSFAEIEKERHRQYRQKRKNEEHENDINNTQCSFTEMEKERHRQYRQKRKNVDHEDKSDNSQSSFTKLEKERHRQYRQKRKNEEHENNSDNTLCSFTELEKEWHHQYRQKRILENDDYNKKESKRHKIYRQFQTVSESQYEIKEAQRQRHIAYRQQRKICNSNNQNKSLIVNNSINKEILNNQISEKQQSNYDYQQIVHTEFLTRNEPGHSRAQNNDNYQYEIENCKNNNYTHIIIDDSVDVENTSIQNVEKQWSNYNCQQNVETDFLIHNEPGPSRIQNNDNYRHKTDNCASNYINVTINDSVNVENTNTQNAGEQQSNYSCQQIIHTEFLTANISEPSRLQNNDHYQYDTENNRNNTNMTINNSINTSITNNEAIEVQQPRHDYQQIIGTELLRNNKPGPSRMQNTDINENYQHEAENTINNYTDYRKHLRAHSEFINKFKNNPFGYECTVCDRLWFKNDLKKSSPEHEEILKNITDLTDVSKAVLCSTCKISLDKQKIPNFAMFNGFKYPKIPSHLPKLTFLTERLVSPRIPFMQIRRLRHIHGQYGIYGQIINVPISIDTMVNKLPRNISDDHSIYVHIKKKMIHKSSYAQGLVKKKDIKLWLQYLINTPLYSLYNITIDESFFNDNIVNNVDNNIDELSEDIPVEESLLAQQQTLVWDEEKYLRLAPGEFNVPQSILFDEHAEELSFPSIYVGHFRQFRDGFNATQFAMASSELRRKDRRGITPQHLLYMAVKIMRIRVRDCLTIAFKYVGTNTRITKEQIESDSYIYNCIESNLAFLRTIPNSVWYWAERKRDLFAMIRQLGKPTAFMTLSANEIGWHDLLELLYNLSKNNDNNIPQFVESELTYIQKSTLINEDAVTCAIYFNKLVNIIITILQSKKFSPFGKYRVQHYFKRIEFQHRGSPHAHILLWLENAPNNIIGENQQDAIEMINNLVSVSKSEASGNIKLQRHKHTFTCYKKIAPNKVQKCRFEAPFMPSRSTLILTPMNSKDRKYKEYYKQYTELKKQLEFNDYNNIDDFMEKHNIVSDEMYYDILRAGITRPRIFIKREPSEKWYNPFNPFVLNILKSNMDFQIITEEYSVAQYVVEYVNKTNRGISNLQRKIREIYDEHPEFDIIQTTRKMSVDLLNTVEMTSQEAAWYLLREPMSKSSVLVVYINTCWPIERQRIKKTQKEISELDEDCTDIWKEDWFNKYEKRPENLDHITLAQFVSKYVKNNRGIYIERQEPRIIRYRNYDIAQDYNEYKREMVTLHIPFRNEETEILAEMKYLTIYDDYEDTILQRRKEFESNLNMQKTIEICRKLCRENETLGDDELEIQNVANRFPEPNPFQDLYNNPNAAINDDLRLATLKNLGAIAKKRENIMDNDQFYQLMRSANEKQKELLNHVINHLLSEQKSPLQIFFTGPAGCGKTFVIKLIMEIYNRFTDNDGICNAYITCASTGKAAVAIDGTTVHTALKISLSKLLPLSIETAHQYRSLFKYIKVLIIDEVSMIGAELLTQIHSRLKQITGNFEVNFGGLDIILIGDLRQLPPVRATPIFKQVKQGLGGPVLWRSLKFFELTQVMRQANEMFANLLTKIGNGTILNEDEIRFIESRFYTKEEAFSQCPNGIRLFFNNHSVSNYNNYILQQSNNKIVSIANDLLNGCHNKEQETFVRQKLHKMTVIDTGSLPYEIIFVINKYYIVTTNIDVSDGLANGAVGKLVHLERNNENEVTRVWLVFADKKTGDNIRKKAAAFANDNNIDKFAVPIARRTSSIPMNNNKTIVVKRNHFPLISGCAMTIHKSQGGTFNEIVYEYDKTHSTSLLYVALSRVTTIEGLYITNINNDLKFYHGRKADTSVKALQEELNRLSLNRLVTVDSLIIDFISKQGFSIFTFNCQSLKKHVNDLKGPVIQASCILILTETWMDEGDNINIPNFDCIVKFKRQNIRSGGVAVYHKKTDESTILTFNNDIITQSNNTHFDIHQIDIGDICTVQYKKEDGIEIIIIAVYISPNQRVNDIIKFIHTKLIDFTPSRSILLNQNLHTIPMILAGDFNVNFASEDSLPLIQFLQSELQLNINNNINDSTTKHGTTIDAVFSRYINNITSKTYISYFSYHKPIISFIESNTE